MDVAAGEEALNSVDFYYAVGSSTHVEPEYVLR